MDKKDKRIKKALNAGAEIVGAAAGAAVGLFGGPAGAVGGAIFGTSLAKGIGEVLDRRLSEREQVKVGASASLILQNVSVRLANGESPRSDNFFDETENSWSKANQLIEGVLIKCKDQFEEGKIPYISNIYGNTVFDDSTTSSNAHQVVTVSEKLTFRQFQIMALIDHNANNQLNLRSIPYEDDAVLGKNLQFILQEFFELYSLGLIHQNDNTALFSLGDVFPAHMILSDLGREYHKLLGLSSIPISSLEFISDLTA